MNMKQIIGIVVVLLCIISTFPTIAQREGQEEKELVTQNEPIMKKLILGEEEQQTSYSEYRTHCPVEPFAVRKVYPTSPITMNSNVETIYIFVPSTIYNMISSEVLQYVNDLATLDLATEIYSGTWGTAEDVKQYLQERYTEHVIGCLMIGAIPCAWYEMEAFGEYEEFPIDLYYMDLDGNWSDTDNDGIYDHHAGDRAPEIWIGRLKADVLSGDEIEFYKNYFYKCHQYRTKAYELPKKALVYIDDDWATDYGFAWNKEVQYAYAQTDLITDKWTTSAKDYTTRLTEGYEMVHLASHSSPFAHYFMDPNGLNGIVTSNDITNIDPHVFFYNLFCCSAARYIETDYIAGAYLFTDTYSLVVLGSTKIGGMWQSTQFYKTLGDGKCFGEAFTKWFTAEGIDRPDWFYGMVLLGDPTLPLTYENPYNTPPEKPHQPTGTPSGKTGKEYSYTTNASDMNGDRLWYLWKWGDGNESGWIGPYPSGDPCTTSYSWSEKGDYEITVKAKDEHGGESEWSDVLSVSMPKNRVSSSYKFSGLFNWLVTFFNENRPFFFSLSMYPIK
jgi:hypothetical protein